MVSWLRRRRLSVSSLAFAGRARRFRRARDPRTAVAWSVSGRVRRDDVAREYGARTAEESLRLKLIGSGRAAHFPRCAAPSCYSDQRSDRATRTCAKCIVLVEVCPAFSHVAACTLAQSPY